MQSTLQIHANNYKRLTGLVPQTPSTCAGKPVISQAPDWCVLLSRCCKSGGMGTTCMALWRCWTPQQAAWCEGCTARASCLGLHLGAGAARCPRRATTSLLMTFNCLGECLCPSQSPECDLCISAIACCSYCSLRNLIASSGKDEKTVNVPENRRLLFGFSRPLVHLHSVTCGCSQPSCAHRTEAQRAESDHKHAAATSKLVLQNCCSVLRMFEDCYISLLCLVCGPL